jgi:hypothetical protein
LLTRVCFSPFPPPLPPFCNMIFPRSSQLCHVFGKGQHCLSAVGQLCLLAVRKRRSPRRVLQRRHGGRLARRSGVQPMRFLCSSTNTCSNVGSYFFCSDRGTHAYSRGLLLLLQRILRCWHQPLGRCQRVPGARVEPATIDRHGIWCVPPPPFFFFLFLFVLLNTSLTTLSLALRSCHSSTPTTPRSCGACSLYQSSFVYDTPL